MFIDLSNISFLIEIIILSKIRSVINDFCIINKNNSSFRKVLILILSNENDFKDSSNIFLKSFSSNKTFFAFKKISSWLISFLLYKVKNRFLNSFLSSSFNLLSVRFLNKAQRLFLALVRFGSIVIAFFKYVIAFINSPNSA